MPPSASDRSAMMAGLREADENGQPEVARARKVRENRERRQLRGEYREFIDDAVANRKDLTNLSAADLEAFVQKGDTMFGRVQRPQEAALDSKAFMTTATSAALKARQLKVDQNAFDTNEFIIRLKRTLGQKRARDGEEEDEDSDEDDEGLGNWTNIGWMGVKYTKRVALPDFLLGPLLVSQKKRNTVKRAKLDIRKEKRAEPEAVVKDSTKKDANESSTLTHKCEEWLVDAFTAADKENRQMSFFEFVVNPKSFSQTVENVFYLSFVINKGLAALDVDEDTGMLNITASEPADAQDAAEGAGKLQMVLEMDMDIWQDAINMLGLKKSRWIPHRSPIAQEGAKGSKPSYYH